MEFCSVVCASHQQWNEYNVPLIKSLRKHEPTMPLVVVDSGSTPPYPERVDDYTTVIRTNNESHCKAINLGLLHCPVSKWYLILDNDTLVSAPIRPMLETLELEAVYGPEMRHWQFGYYVVGWCIAIPHKVMLSVGLYDECFVKILYEETDYCYRAVGHGFGVRKASLPISHVGGGGGSRKFVNSKELTWINLAHFLNKHKLTWRFTEEK